MLATLLTVLTSVAVTLAVTRVVVGVLYEVKPRRWWPLRLTDSTFIRVFDGQDEVLVPVKDPDAVKASKNGLSNRNSIIVFDGVEELRVPVKGPGSTMPRPSQPIQVSSDAGDRAD
jgi:hypothetical protein